MGTARNASRSVATAECSGLLYEMPKGGTIHFYDAEAAGTDR
jgi:hypothetical protein